MHSHTVIEGRARAFKMAGPGTRRNNADSESIIREEVGNCFREELQNSSSGAQLRISSSC